MIRSLCLTLIAVCFSLFGRASHVLGGDITWTCQGGDYVFQLVFYRDCNGADVNTISANLDVWNYPGLTSITLNYVSRTDVSPLCTEVPAGPTALDCGTGAYNGNGVGAIEKVIYQSAPISLTGTPPAEGWVFTYQNFSRSNSLTNVTDPSTVGITLSAIMFAIPGGNGSCVDNSPQFLQDPYFVSCVGDPYEYNMNAVDPDLDSLAIFFGTPYDHFPSATSYNPPIEPAPVIFEPGFSATSPTPGPGLNPANIVAQVDPSSGNLTFLSNNIGNFAVKIVAQSYRNGILISQVEREMQLIVANCAGTNTAPVIAGPFAGLFETTVVAGTPVNFTLNATDVELLQDGSPQNNILSATGPMFGNNFTSPLGCDIEPCATLDATPLITMSQGVSADFDWQTTCDHLVNPYGDVADVVPYHFVFKVQDDYCPVPKVSYATVTINVVNPGIIQAPNIDCIQSDINGDVTITWNPVNDPNGTFVSYEIYSVQNGLEGTVGAIGTSSFTIPGVTQENDYILGVVSGCNGNTTRYSDTISNIYLNVNNPANGTAVLLWNDPISPPLSSMGEYYHVYREYPATVWTIIDSVPYGTTNYVDTIDICSVYLNYQIVLPNQPCDFTSNIAGDNFEDILTPDIPIISNVSVDTLTGFVNINWNENYQQDTYGYIVYAMDVNGFIVEIDTVWGISNTSYAHDTIVDGPLTYSVAAFDSCWTTSFPPTYQTSAKADLHTTIYTTAVLDVCTRKVNLSWTSYGGWNGIDHYEIFGRENNGVWINLGTTTSTIYNLDANAGSSYCFAILAVSDDGVESFSNISCLFINSPNSPSFNYLMVGTVVNEEVVLDHYIENSTAVTAVSFQKMNEQGEFEEMTQVPVVSNFVSYIDTDVNVDEKSYTYRTQIVDSCGNLADSSNEARTIYLQVQYDEVTKLNYLNWNPYHQFDGSILGYNIYRGIDGVFNTTPLATVPSAQWSLIDSTLQVVSIGKICYLVEAIESVNQYGFAERSRSNEACAIYPPIIYVPNTFTPNNDAKNEVFLPILSDFDPSQYEFTVFDRWGRILFETNDPYQGWDGNIDLNNRLATSGTYVWMIVLTDGNGEEVVARGYVNLLK